MITKFNSNKRKGLCLRTKINIFNNLKTVKQSEVVNKSTVTTIKSNETKIRKIFIDNEKETINRRRNCTAVELDDAFLMWFM